MHNESEIIGVKPVKKFIGDHHHKIDEVTGKKVGVRNYQFRPMFYTYPISSKIKLQIYRQVYTADKFLKLYRIHDFLLNRNKGDNTFTYRKNCEIIFNDPKVFSKEVGVFKLFHKENGKKKKG